LRGAGLDIGYGKILIVASESYCVCPAVGAKLRTERDATDLIGEAHSFDVIVIPVERLDEEFFRLRTGLAGAFLQKFVTYGRRVVIVGDISRHTEQSSALRDFVVESNRGHHVWFVATIEDLERSSKLVK
jgi:hypothetical protein